MKMRLAIRGYDVLGILECIIYVSTIVFCVGFMFGLGAWLAWKLVGLL
jgi:hypothetical protein